MAKSRSFFGLRRGSTKSFTFSVLGGQQITKDRVQEVRNPRTYPQQYQRAKFASIVKYFKQLPQGLLTYAYEDKKPNESYYNAFMRHNANTICSYLANQNANNGILAAGDVVISDGSLGEVKLYRGIVGENGYDFLTNIRNTVGAIDTVADLSKVLIAAGFMSGDIVNCIVQSSDATVSGTAPFLENDGAAERFDLIFSCYVDTLDNTVISSHVKAPSAEFSELLQFSDLSGTLAVNVMLGEDFKNINAALIISRRTSGGVKVTKSNMTCPAVFPLEQMLFSAYRPQPSRPGVAPQTNWTELVAQSYDGAEGEAILQGGLVTEGEVPLNIVALGSPTPDTIVRIHSVEFNRPTTIEELAGKLQLVASEGSFTLNSQGRFMAGTTQVTSAGNMMEGGLKFIIGIAQSGFASTTISDVVLAE